MKNVKEVLRDIDPFWIKMVASGWPNSFENPSEHDESEYFDATKVLLQRILDKISLYK